MARGVSLYYVSMLNVKHNNTIYETRLRKLWGNYGGGGIIGFRKLRFIRKPDKPASK